MNKPPLPALVASSLLLTHSALAQDVQLLNSFETTADVAAASANGTRLEATSQHATQGKQALRIEYQPGIEWPNAGFAAVQPLDWREWGTLVVDVTNPGKEMVEVGIGLGDAAGPDGAKHWRSGPANIAPGSAATLAFPLQGNVQDIGMDNLPGGVPNSLTIRTYGTDPNLSRIALFSIFMKGPQAPTSIVVDNIRLAKAVKLDGVVDQFGQNSEANWTGKVRQVADLKSAQQAEATDWKTNPVAPERNQYGGWTKGPQLQATGFFRTQKVDGKWWLVDPEGRLFFSVGITTINHDAPTDQYTRITGREKLFTWLPEANDPLNVRHNSVRGTDRYFNFYSANLERKYGPAYPQNWLDATKNRLLSWGFNTVGDFSSRELYNIKVPYCVMAGAWGGHRRVKGGDIDIDDPYDPQFATDLANNLRHLSPNAPGDPYCIGYFVDNELTWGGSASDQQRFAIARTVLGSGGDSPAKQAMLSQLRKQYTNIAALNTRWTTNFPNWEALQNPFTPNPAQEGAMKADFTAYMQAFAAQHYRTVRETVKAFDPNHLYLGDKYMVTRYTPEALQAANQFCDVISFDIYEADVASQKWESLKTLDKPCIVGEFHFGALDRGLFGAGMVSTSNQTQRAAAYERYVRSVAEHPAFVGCHWFQYVDQPLTARAFDRENHNVGFMNVTDTPYPELVTAARRANAEVYRRRTGR